MKIWCGTNLYYVEFNYIAMASLHVAMTTVAYPWPYYYSHPVHKFIAVGLAYLCQI